MRSLTMDHVLAPHAQHPAEPADSDAPQVRAVAPDAPLLWLRAGWQDLQQAGSTSLAYGLLVAAFGLVLLLLGWNATYLVPALVGGFMLVAPFAAIGVYALSRQIDQGEPVDATAAAFAWRRNTGSIALFGLMLALALISWERLSAIVFALFYGGQVPVLQHLMRDLLLSGQYNALIVAWLGCGALMAAVVFCLTVITAPMLLDRPVDVVSATLASLRCCRANPAPLALWALLLAGLTALGFATAMLGLIVIFPWLGHASWHAYRALLVEAPQPR
jgi:uncharacterized membrane protein